MRIFLHKAPYFSFLKHTNERKKSTTIGYCIKCHLISLKGRRTKWACHKPTLRWIFIIKQKVQQCYVSVGIRNGNFVHSEWIFLTDYNLKIQFESLEISIKCWVCFSKRFLYFCVSLLWVTAVVVVYKFCPEGHTSKVSILSFTP